MHIIIVILSPAIHSFITEIIPARTRIHKSSAGTLDTLRNLDIIRKSHQLISICFIVALVIQTLAPMPWDKNNNTNSNDKAETTDKNSIKKANTSTPSKKKE